MSAAAAAAAQSPSLDLFARYIATPLEFGRYHVNLTPTGEMYGGGGIYLRSRDALKLGQLYLDGGKWNGVQVVSKEWVERSTTPVATFARPMSPNDRDHRYGYGWHIHDTIVDGRTHRWYEANGNGGQWVMVFPTLDLVVGITGGKYMAGAGLVRMGPRRRRASHHSGHAALKLRRSCTSRRSSSPCSPRPSSSRVIRLPVEQRDGKTRQASTNGVHDDSSHPVRAGGRLCGGDTHAAGAGSVAGPSLASISDLPFAERVAALVGEMTLEEKVGQMVDQAPAIGRLGRADLWLVERGATRVSRVRVSAPCSRRRSRWPPRSTRP